MSDHTWVELWLRFLGEMTLKATALLIAAFAVSWLLRRASAATRRRLWAGTVVALLLLPVMAAVLPPLARVPVPAAAARLSPFAETAMAPVAGQPAALADLRGSPPEAPAAVIARSPVPGEPGRSGLAGSSTLSAAALTVYLAGLTIALLRLIRARRQARGLLRDAGCADPAWQLPIGVACRESETVRLPQTLGSWRSVVLLPRSGRSWPEAWRSAVVAHEVAHVRGRDPLWQLLGEVAAALYWFHPLAHMALRQLRIERELTADDATLATGMRPSEYAAVLFELACIPDQPVALGSVVPLLTPGGLKARVRAVLQAGQPRRSGRGMGLLLGAVGLTAVVPLATAVPAAAPAMSGVLVGRVIDAENRPVAGAEVVFTPDGVFKHVLVGAGGTPRVFSDDDGWFRYPESLPWQVVFDVFARKGSLAARKGIMAVKYGTSLPTTLELRRGHTLSGTVRDDQGRGVAGATLRILEDSRESPGPGTQILAETDRDGRWQISGMLYGNFQLLARAPWGVASTVGTIVGDRDVGGLDAVVAREWPVTGRLQDEQGRPIAHSRVEHPHLWVSSSRAEMWEHSTLPGERHLDWDETAADGSFRLMPRGHEVFVEARDPVGNALFAQFEDGGSRYRGTRGFQRERPASSAPIVVTLTRKARVSGVVRSAGGAAMPGSRVYVEFVGPKRSFFHASGTITDADGRFQLSVPATNVTLVAQASRGRDLTRRSQLVELRLRPGELRRDLEILVPSP